MAQPAFLRSIRFAVLLSLCLLALGCSRGGPDVEVAAGEGTETGGGSAATDLGPVLDGGMKSLVVVGYSTSYVWPAMLQDMLDEHAGGEAVGQNQQGQPRQPLETLH